MRPVDPSCSECRDCDGERDTLRDDLQRENQVLREKIPRARGGLAPWQLKRTEAWMCKNLSGQVPLGPLAEQCGLSVRHFARAFRHSTGVPPHRWLLNRRLERAKELLPDSKLSLSAIALACGFGDQSHFTRMFSAAVRMSPGLWRRLQSVSKAEAERLPPLKPTLDANRPRRTLRSLNQGHNAPLRRARSKSDCAASV
jgi:AraC-like DNA-binding protein